MTAAALLVCWLGAAAGVSPPQDPDRAAALVAEGRKRLAAIGFSVPAGVKVAERRGEEVLADLDAQQAVLFPPGGFAVQHALRIALGLDGAKDAAALRAQTVAGMASGLSAFYDPIRKSLVLLPTVSRDVAKLAGGGMLPLVAHELVHACQDARDGGLTKFFDATRVTIDATLVRRCVIEGEAELASAVAMTGEGGVEALLAGGIEIEKLLSGELTALIYEHGRRLSATRFRAAGWPGVRELWGAPPPSCEQVMHAEKLGRDVPQAVAVPAIEGTDVLQRTTLGELLIYSLLRERGLGVRDAAVAAAGWDGDELVLLKTRAGAAEGLVWRTVWDRDEDAAQFAAALPAMEGVVATAKGRSVDFVAAADSGLRAKLAAACAAAPSAKAADEADAASTAAVEAALRTRDAASAVRGAKWEQPALGLSIPVPERWELREVQGTKLLFDTATMGSGFAVNVNVQALPRGQLADLDAMLEVNRTQLEQLKVTVVAIEIGKCGEADVIRGEFHGRLGPTPLHCLQLMYLRGQQQVIVTATASPKQWPGQEKTLRELMAGIVVTPP